MALATLPPPTEPNPPRSPLLQLRGVSLSFGNLRVLKGVEFEIEPGEVVALTGENESGKTTIVRCIARDLAPDHGEVLLKGERLPVRPGGENRDLAVVWQDLSFCDNLDVAANVFLGKEHRNWFLSDPRARAATRSLLSSYGIGVDATRSVASLSSVELKLVAIARAMQSEPRVLVLDEPTEALGVQETRQVEDLIEKVKAQGTTILLVTRDVNQAFHLADRILVLRDGRVVADVAPTESHPDDVVAIMSGRAPDVTARQQLSRLQSLVDQLASERPNSSLPLVASALSAALGTGQLCIHLLDEQTLRCVAATGLPPDMLEAWTAVPVGRVGGPMGMAAQTRRIVIDEDVTKSPSWAPFAALRAKAGIRSSWSVPIIGSRGLIGAITGCQQSVGRPQADQLELVSLYAGYAAGAIERDQLYGEATARNRVLETIREVLETLAGPEPVSSGLLSALQSLRRGLRADEVELWAKSDDAPARCVALVDANDRAHTNPIGRESAGAERVLGEFTHPVSPQAVAGEDAGQVVATTFDAPGGRFALWSRWGGLEPPEDAVALLEDAAHSVRLALERQEAEQAHQQAEALRRSHQLQRDFLFRLSHELRTPLTAIRGYASSLLAPDVTWDDESRARFLSRIAGESARLGRLVGDLLDFSAIESDLLRLQSDWCDLSLIIEAALSCLPAERADMVSVDCPATIGPLWGDHDRLEQVFVNLLENSFRHNAPGIHVELRAWKSSSEIVQVRVADNGKGISEPLRKKLFQPRAREIEDAPGAGLGLSITKAIVRAHGGDIVLEESDQGASFLVKLPSEAPAGATA
ncbi:MAG: ATP-binding cassette domain-containing protein [Acidimicrobiales bacterium]